MTRQDFVLIAEVVREEIRDADAHDDIARVAALRLVASAFAKRLRSTNPGFKSELFLAACGIDE
jgi:hypothetical protein